jgi:hypothetical protein
MKHSGDLTERHKRILLALQAVISLLLLSYWLLPKAGVSFPGAVYGAVALACLIGMLVVFWKAGVLRGSLVLLFAAALLLAPGVAWFAAHT